MDIWSLLALLLSTAGSVVIYLTNKNQNLIRKPINKVWRVATLLSWTLALCIWVNFYVMSTAFFIWLFTITILVICVPLLSLFNKVGKY